MKLIEELEPQTLQKEFITPKKKEKYFKSECEELNHDVGSLPICAFDLGSSPRLIGTTRINLKEHSTQKIKISNSSKKIYSPPIIIKYEEISNKSQSTLKKWKKSTKNKSMKIDDSSLTNNLIAYYNRINEKLQKQDVKIPRPEIIDPCLQSAIYSQIFTFQLNTKNSRWLAYDEQTQTIKSLYECYGCNTNFSKASSLGGHLSSCQKKSLHYQKLNEGYNNCQIIEDKCSQTIEKSQVKIQEISNKKRAHKNSEKQFQNFFGNSDQIFMYPSSSQKSVEKKRINESRKNPQLKKKTRDLLTFEPKVIIQFKSLKKINKREASKRVEAKKSSKKYKRIKKE